MINTTALFNGAELAFASYANLIAGSTSGTNNQDALACPTGAGLSLTQATAFATRFPTIVTQYNDLTALGGMGTVRQIQLLQDAADHIEVRLVTDRALTAEESARFTVVLQECLGYPFRMTLNRVPAIVRNFGQKYEDFVSLLEH